MNDFNQNILNVNIHIYTLLSLLIEVATVLGKMTYSWRWHLEPLQHSL